MEFPSILTPIKPIQKKSNIYTQYTLDFFEGARPEKMPKNSSIIWKLKSTFSKFSKLLATFIHYFERYFFYTRQNISTIRCGHKKCPRGHPHLKDVFILFVQEEVTHFIQFLYKMGNYFLDIWYHYRLVFFKSTLIFISLYYGPYSAVQLRLKQHFDTFLSNADVYRKK